MGTIVDYGYVNEPAYKVVKYLNNSKRQIISDDKAKGTVSLTLGNLFSMSKNQSETVTEFEWFIENNVNKIMQIRWR